MPANLVFVVAAGSILGCGSGTALGCFSDGDCGGPVLDSSGNVVGVVSHILSKKYADKSGHIAQNVNFAVKSYLVEGFLSSNNVSFEKAESTEKLELPDIAEKAERFTVLIGCWE